MRAFADRFPPLPPERFSAFHEEFHWDTWDVCDHCGGQCEINKTASLMPGEVEYLAGIRGETAEDFRAKYLDGIATPYGVIDVLKLKLGCPFLDQNLRCTIKPVKVVLCAAYPVVFSVEGNAVRFEMDTWCPIAGRMPELSKQLEEHAVPALRRIGAPVRWYEAVALYDGLCIDHDKLFALRASEPGYAILTIPSLRLASHSGNTDKMSG